MRWNPIDPLTWAYRRHPSPFYSPAMAALGERVFVASGATV